MEDVDWHLNKENICPLVEGRDIQILKEEKVIEEKGNDELDIWMMFFVVVYLFLLLIYQKNKK